MSKEDRYREISDFLNWRERRHEIKRNEEFNESRMVEIERKFLVKNADWLKDATSVLRITQGYFSKDDKKVVRVRSSYADRDKYMGGEYTLTIKDAKNSVTRMEVELPLTHEQFHKLYLSCDQGRIQKKRFIVHNGRDKWEIDVFEDGSVVAEIELLSEDQEIELPDWVGEEVTGKPEYYNSNMAK